MAIAMTGINRLANMKLNMNDFPLNLNLENAYAAGGPSKEFITMTQKDTIKLFLNAGEINLASCEILLRMTPLTSIELGISPVKI